MTKILRTAEESGRSMVEMLGVLAIVGVLSIGGITGYSKAMAKYKINKTLDQVSMLITNIRTTYGNQASYAGLDNATAIAYDMAGNDLSQGTSADLKNAYTGDVTILALATKEATEACAAGSYCPVFSIKFEGIEKAACVQIASADWGGTVSSGLQRITVGSTPFDWAATQSEASLPITFSAAATACSGDTNTITWFYN